MQYLVILVFIPGHSPPVRVTPPLPLSTYMQYLVILEFIPGPTPPVRVTPPLPLSTYMHYLVILVFIPGHTPPVRVTPTLPLSTYIQYLVILVFIPSHTCREGNPTSHLCVSECSTCFFFNVKTYVRMTPPWGWPPFFTYLVIHAVNIPYLVVEFDPPSSSRDHVFSVGQSPYPRSHIDDMLCSNITLIYS